MKIQIYPPIYIHQIGRRFTQEDALTQWDNRLFVLCDGMGGHEKGEVASQTVCQALEAWFQAHVKPELPFTDDQLKEALLYAYQALDQRADDASKQMCTTLTLLYLGINGVTAAHIGDSRIYHIRPKEGVLYQSRDHSLVFDLLEAGEITLKEMDNHPQKNIVTRAMTPGADKRTHADIIHITDVQPDDYFFLCSDGMLEQMDNDELVSLLTYKRTDAEKHEQLMAITSTNTDNHSAWIIHVKEVTKESGDEALVNEESTVAFNAINVIRKAQELEANKVAESARQKAEEAERAKATPLPPAKKKSLYKAFIFLFFAILIFLLALWMLEQL